MTWNNDFLLCCVLFSPAWCRSCAGVGRRLVCYFLNRHINEKNNNEKRSAVSINNDDVTWWCIARYTTILERNVFIQHQLNDFSRCCWFCDDDKRRFLTCRYLAERTQRKQIVWRRNETISWIWGMENKLKRKKNKNNKTYEKNGLIYC